MRDEKTEIIAEPGKQEIFMSREFDAPVALVFRAHTDPKLFARWFGCRGMTTKVVEFEARSGGKFRYSQTLNGRDFFVSRGVYHEVTFLESIVRTVEIDAKPGRVSLETTRFEVLQGERTKVITQSVFQSIADRDGLIESGVESGAQETFQRLDDLLSTINSP